jgi:uncharacterized protein (DUF927 family)
MIMVKDELREKIERLSDELMKAEYKDTLSKDFDRYALALAVLKESLEKQGFREDQAFSIVLKTIEIGGIQRG